jgi:pimeloyl-ACP methyl ester carboxylesterase
VTAPLPAAIDSDEWRVQLAGCGEVLCYRDSGGDGAPVLLLHSVNAAPSAREVRPLFDALRGERPVFAPDLPGFGRSNREPREYLPAFFADFILALLDAMDAGPVHVVALSTSAEFAARAALAQPGRFASLTLVSPTGLGKRNPPSGAKAERIHRFLNLPLIGKGAFRLLRTRPSVRFFLGLAFDGPPPAELVDYAVLTAAQPGATHVPFRFLSGQLFTPDAAELLYRPLQVPVHVLYDYDPNVGFERLDTLLRSCENWSATRIHGTRGLPHYQRLDETVNALRDFWASLGRP